MISIFDGSKDAYWWLICSKKCFNSRGLSDAWKLIEIVLAMRGSALTWWLWWSHRNPKSNWESFTIAFLWQFHPEFHNVLPLPKDEVATSNSDCTTSTMLPIVTDHIEIPTTLTLLEKEEKQEAISQLFPCVEQTSLPSPILCPYVSKPLNLPPLFCSIVGTPTQQPSHMLTMTNQFSTKPPYQKSTPPLPLFDSDSTKVLLDVACSLGYLQLQSGLDVPIFDTSPYDPGPLKSPTLTAVSLDKLGLHSIEPSISRDSYSH